MALLGPDAECARGGRSARQDAKWKTCREPSQQYARRGQIRERILCEVRAIKERTETNRKRCSGHRRHSHFDRSQSGMNGARRDEGNNNVKSRRGAGCVCVSAGNFSARDKSDGGADDGWLVQQPNKARQHSILSIQLKMNSTLKIQ